MATFWAELKRRRVFQVIAVYALVAWLLMQIVDVVNEPLSLPPWFDTVVIVLLAIGFPIAVILAWAFDITPQGVVRTEAIGGAMPPESLSQRELQVAEDSAGAMNHAPGESDGNFLEDSLAVLPFENVSPNPDDSYFAVGVHDEILSQLSKIRGLHVIARTSVLRYAGGEHTIPEIARALKVQAVMEGTVRYSDNRVRITAQVIDGVRNTHLWSDRFDRQLEDIFDIQTDIARRIADALRVELSLDELRSIENRPTESTEAYQHYLRAIAIVREGDSAIGVTAPPGKRSSIQTLLDRAIALDPNFALAFAWKAWIYTFSRAYSPIDGAHWATRTAELDNQARTNAEKALTLNSGLALAYAALAKVNLYNNAITSAEADFERALATGANDPEVLRWYANFRWLAGHHDDAIRFAIRAVDLDPENPFYYDVLGRVYHSTGNYEAAARAYRKSVDISPGGSIGYVSLARPEFALGNEAAALDALRTAEQLMSADASPGVRADLAMGYRRLGEAENARTIFERIKDQSESRYICPAVWALAYLSIADQQRALDSMKEIIEKPELVSNLFTFMFLKENAWSDPILEQPEFVEIRSALGFRS